MKRPAGHQRAICVVTGSRAEYGLMQWLMGEIEADPVLALQVVVTGAHLDPRFGETWRTIEQDGFTIDMRVPLDLRDDTSLATARAFGAGVGGMAEALGKLMPDLVVVLGDRYEILAAATAALLQRLPIAHIHGGELTEGAFDDAMRHAITKLSHLHFTSAEPYRRRVIQMGEDPAHVFAVGALGLDGIDRLRLLERAELSHFLGLDLSGGYFLVTYHPLTLGESDPGTPVEALLTALDDFSERRILITGANADPGNGRVGRLLAAYAARHPNRVALVASLGQQRYLSAMKHADLVIGNSSSGVIEAPAMKIMTVNIGDRQKGRLRSSSIVDCGEDRNSIVSAIRRAIDPAFKAVALAARPPHGEPGASLRIKAVIRDIPLERLLRKRFFDLPFGAVATV